MDMSDDWEERNPHRDALQKRAQERHETLCRRIQERLDATGLSANSVSARAGLDRSFLGKILIGKIKEPKETKLESVAAVLGVSLAWLKGDTDVMLGSNSIPRQSEENTTIQLTPISANSRDVPIVGVTEAGSFREVVELDEATMGVILNGYELSYSGERQFAFEVRGDSMNLLHITHGDHVVCVDPWEAGLEIGDGSLVVVERKNGHMKELTLKQMAIREDHWELQPRSDNPTHKPIIIPKGYDLGDDLEVRVVGVVVAIRKPPPVLPRYSARGGSPMPGSRGSSGRGKKSASVVAAMALMGASIALPCQACEAWGDPLQPHSTETNRTITEKNLRVAARVVKLERMNDARIQVALPLAAPAGEKGPNS